MRILSAISRYIDNVTEIAGNVASWLTTLLVLLICYDVTMRYAFNTSSARITELEWHIFSLTFLLGAGYALKHNRHVRVDVFYGNFSPKTKAWIDILGTVIFLIPFCIITIALSVKFAYNSYIINETSPDPGGLPYLFLIKSSIPLGFFLLLLQGISMLCKDIITLKHKENQSAHL